MKETALHIIRYQRLDSLINAILSNDEQLPGDFRVSLGRAKTVALYRLSELTKNNKEREQDNG